jgi:hypothetical protein
VILGLVTLVAGLGFADAIAVLLRVFPAGVLGVVLLLGSLQLAAPVRLDDGARPARYVTFATAALGMWNMGLGFAAPLARQPPVAAHVNAARWTSGRSPHRREAGARSGRLKPGARTATLRRRGGGHPGAGG